MTDERTTPDDGPDFLDGAEDPEGTDPPPSIWSFVERGAGRIALEAALGATAAYLLAGALELQDMRWSLALLGAVLAPVALLLTPVSGSVAYRGLRYGGALAILVTLVVSFTGEGRDRPLEDLLVWGLFFFIVGATAHGLMVLTLDRRVRDGDEIPGEDGRG